MSINALWCQDRTLWAMMKMPQPLVYDWFPRIRVQGGVCWINVASILWAWFICVWVVILIGLSPEAQSLIEDRWIAATCLLHPDWVCWPLDWGFVVFVCYVRVEPCEVYYSHFFSSHSLSNLWNSLTFSLRSSIAFADWFLEDLHHFLSEYTSVVVWEGNCFGCLLCEN